MEGKTGSKIKQNDQNHTIKIPDNIVGTVVHFLVFQVSISSLVLPTCLIVFEVLQVVE